MKGNQLSILMIASGAMLDTSSELNHIIATHDVDSIIDAHATLENIIVRTRGRSYDVLHITGHFEDEYFIFANNVKLHRSQVAQIANRIDAKLVYANGCGTIFLGQYLIDKGVPAAITNSIQVITEQGLGKLEIFDATAIMTATLYYDEVFKNGGELRQAFDEIKSDDGSLSWHSNGNFVAKAVEPLVKQMKALKSSSKYQCWMITAIAITTGLNCVGVFILALIVIRG